MSDFPADSDLSDINPSGIENEMEVSDVNGPFQNVRSSKRKPSGDRPTIENNKKPKVHNTYEPYLNHTVYIKGIDCTISKPNLARVVKNALVNEIDEVEKIQTAGESLRVICKSISQKQRLLLTKRIGTFNIETSEPRGLTQTEANFKTRANRGIIHGVDIDFPVEDILEELRNNEVTKVVRLQKSEGKTKVNTHSIILTFSSESLPERINLGWKSHKVSEFIPRPIQCYKCFRFGHIANACKASQLRCPKCSGPHSVTECKVTIEEKKCGNCGGPHSVTYKGCPKYHEAQQVCETAIKGKMSYSDALKSVRVENKAKDAEKTNSKGKIASSGSDTSHKSNNLNSQNNKINNAANSKTEGNSTVSKDPIQFTVPELDKRLFEIYKFLTNDLFKVLAPSYLHSGASKQIYEGLYNAFGIQPSKECPAPETAADSESISFQ
jgi:hypothetical protein